MYQLPSPCQPFPGESLASLIVRNAERFRFRDPIRVVHYAAPSANNLVTMVTQYWSPEFRANLATLLGLDEQRLSEMTYGQLDRSSIRLFGFELHRDFIMPARRRLCPLCLQVGDYHRLLWDLTVLTVCPIHAVRLVDRCPDPKCGRPLDWRTSSVSSCSSRTCNADIATTSPCVVSPEKMVGVQAIAAYLQGTRELDVGPPGLNAADILLLATQLGAFSVGIEKVGRPTALYEHYADSLHDVLNAGWETLANWPSNFHSLLDSLWAKSEGRRGRYGLRKGFGYLSHWLSRMSNEPWCRPVAEAFSMYIARKEDFASTAAGLRRYGSEAAVQQRHFTLGEAARHLGVSSQTMTSLAKREDLYLVPPSGLGAPSLLRVDKIHALAKRKASMLLKGDVEDLLGVSRAAMRDLERAGFIPVAFADERVTDQRRYRRGDLEDLVSSLEALVPTEVAPRSDGKLLPMTKGLWLSCNLADICKAMLEGKLLPAAIDPTEQGLRRILIAKQDVLSVFPKERETLSVVQAAHELGVAAETARLWVTLGFLQSVILTDVAAERGLRVTTDALAEFRTEYGAAATIAEELGVGSGRWLTRRLAYYGVKPVSGPAVDGAQSSLFRRSDIPCDITARLHAPKKSKRENNSNKEAFGLAATIGKAAAPVLKCSLKRGWNDFRNDERDIYVQVLTGRQLTFMGAYTFRLNERKVNALEWATQAWVAFAFPKQTFYLLVPWAEVLPLVDRSKVDRHAISVRVDAQGEVDRFGMHRHELPALAQKLSQNRQTVT